jgi:hypothetical protein
MCAEKDFHHLFFAGLTCPRPLPKRAERGGLGLKRGRGFGFCHWGWVSGYDHMLHLQRNLALERERERERERRRNLLENSDGWCGSNRFGMWPSVSDDPQDCFGSTA